MRCPSLHILPPSVVVNKVESKRTSCSHTAFRMVISQDRNPISYLHHAFCCCVVCRRPPHIHAPLNNKQVSRRRKDCQMAQHVRKAISTTPRLHRQWGGGEKPPKKKNSLIQNRYPTSMCFCTNGGISRRKEEQSDRKKGMRHEELNQYLRVSPTPLNDFDRQANHPHSPAGPGSRRTPSRTRAGASRRTGACRPSGGPSRPTSCPSRRSSARRRRPSRRA
jgi:hypothetical protein